MPSPKKVSGAKTEEKNRAAFKRVPFMPSFLNGTLLWENSLLSGQKVISRLQRWQNSTPTTLLLVATYDEEWALIAPLCSGDIFQFLAFTTRRDSLVRLEKTYSDWLLKRKKKKKKWVKKGCATSRNFCPELWPRGQFREESHELYSPFSRFNEIEAYTNFLFSRGEILCSFFRGMKCRQTAR